MVYKKFLSLFLLLNFFSTNGAIISKAYYHVGRCEDKLVFYLDQEPQIITKKQRGYQEYILKNVTVSKSAYTAIKSILNKSSLYHVVDMQKKQNSFVVSIKFNPKKISKVYAAKFKPISKPWGLSIKMLRAGVNGKRACIRKVSKKEVVLDFGHGGRDFGTSVNGVHEKDVVQNVGLKLAQILKNQGYVVHLTRNSDNYVALDERTHYANMHTNAALFVSLHANYSGKASVNGLETYYMHYDLMSSLDKSSINRHLLNVRSELLANRVHQSLINAGKKYNLNDRKVKQSVSQVLLGVEMPAILIELGFISNPNESKLLSTNSYQSFLAQNISRGISAYFAVV